MKSSWFINKDGNPYVNYIVGINLRIRGLDLSVDEVEDVSPIQKFDYSNPVYRKVVQKLKVIKSNVHSPDTIFSIEYLQYRKTVNKSGKQIKQWTDTRINAVDVHEPSSLSKFFN